MRSVATVIASLLPPEAAQAIRQITRNKELDTLDEQMRPVANPELPVIARALPADTAYQIARTAERLGFTDYSDVVAEVANAVTRRAGRPKGSRRPARSHLRFERTRRGAPPCFARPRTRPLARTGAVSRISAEDHPA